MIVGPRRGLAGAITALSLELALLGPAGAAETAATPAAARRGPSGEPGRPAEGGLERELAQQLARLDERLSLRTFPNGSPLWPARMAAAIDYLLGPSRGEEDIAGASFLRRLAVDLRHLGDRGLGGPPPKPGRAAEPPGDERTERLRRILGTMRFLHEKLDHADIGGGPEDRVARRAVPSNDPCASAQPVSTGTFHGSTADATQDGTASCGISSASPDVWYRFTAPADRTYWFDTFGSSYDTVLSLWTGCEQGDGRASEIACSDDVEGTLHSKLPHSMTAGEEVWVRVSGSSGAAGEYTLRVLENRGISGSVTRSDTGAPLAGVEVEVYDSSGGYLTETVTGSDGSYLILLEAGTYYLKTRSSGFIDEVHLNLSCPFYNPCSPDDGWPVTVSSTVVDIDFVLQPAASLAGIVTDAATANPLAGYVHLYAATGGILESFFTGSDGTYEITGLPSSHYYLRAEVSDYRSELYNDVPCEGWCDPTSGTLVQVPAGATLTGLDFALDLSPTIAGTLTEEGSEEPIAGQPVSLLDSDGWFIDWTWTSGEGVYRFQDISPGTYFVGTSTELHRNELYDDIPCDPSCSVTAGTGVEARLGSPVTGIDFVLVPHGRISGTVVEAGSGAPLADVRVLAYDSQGNVVRGDQASSDGSYRIEGLPSGTYYIRTDSETHQNEAYDNVVCDLHCSPTIGTAVAATDGSTTTGIDFALRRRGSITGRITHTISGSPLAEGSVHVINTSLDFVDGVFLDPDGTYEFEDLPTDSYYVRTVATGYQNELYDDIPCSGGCNLLVGAAVAVQPETTTSGIDFALDRFGFIEGRVTASDSGLPLETDVDVLGSTGNVVGTGVSSGGDFRIEGIPPGNYYVKTDSSWSAPEYQDELFDGVPCDPSCDLSLGTPLPVQLNGGVTGIELALGLCPGISYFDMVNWFIDWTFAAEACERVSATDVTIASGADVIFKAGRTVVLGDGFRVEAGASFRAVIEPAWTDD